MDDCSDVMLHYDKDTARQPIGLLGHNEDNSKDTVGTSYFVFAGLVRFLASELVKDLAFLQAMQVLGSLQVLYCRKSWPHHVKR